MSPHRSNGHHAGSSATAKPLPPVNVHFLGTSSGGGPIVSRNCSCTAVDFGNEIWLFDAADGSHFRLQQSSLKMSNISRIFVTHMHADHTLGIVPIMTTLMSGVNAGPEYLAKLKQQGRHKKPDFHLYGPRGLRELIRTTLRITDAHLSGVYVVHELLKEGQTGSVGCGEDELHVNEAVGRDVKPDEHGVWPHVLAEGNGKSSRGWGVQAGPIVHRVPARGYVLSEPTPTLPLDTARLIPLLKANAPALATLDPPVKHPLSLLSRLTALPPPEPFTLPSGETLHPPAPSGVAGRKLVIFGDCDGGTPNAHFTDMCSNPSLLVHECTNCSLPDRIARGKKVREARVKALEHSLVKKRELQGHYVIGLESEAGPTEEEAQLMTLKQAEEAREKAKIEETRCKAKKRGHSTPAEVGEFARRIDARRLVVNHFSAMFPCPRYPSSQPYPSMLMPISPHQAPVPWPVPYNLDPPLRNIPLTRSDLHLRVMMQSLADQIDAIWNDRSANDSKDDAAVEGSPNLAQSSQTRHHYRMAIPARDYMVLHVPSHGLSPDEVKVQDRHRKEVEWVMGSFAEQGGIWYEMKDGKRRWIGIEDAPGQQTTESQ